jgi:hypothetical protein
MDLGMKHIDSLSVTEKISLYNCLYKDLAGKGIDGDTELAHVNKEEMEVLRSMGGSGTINPHTNLIQYKGGSRSGGTQTVRQEATFPEELRPFIQDIFGKAQAIQEERDKEGYTPFQGPRIADFTEDQKTAFQGVRDTVGTSDPYFTRSEELFESSTAAPTAESVGQFMNPYIQNVLDIERREARRDAETVGQGIAGRSARAGGFGGSREAILSAENERNTQRNLADIQSRGLASAFEDAQSRLAQQRGRELAAGQQFSNLGTTVPAQRLRELQALEATGAAQQQQTQQGLDIAQQEFEIGRTFPERTLQDYSAILRGFTQPLPATTFRTQNTFSPRASFGQQAAGVAGLGLQAANVFKPQGGYNFFGAKEGGLVGLANGGKVARYQKGSLIDSGRISNILQEAGYTPEEFKKLSKDQQNNVIQSINSSRWLNRKAAGLTQIPAAAADVATMPIRMGIDAADVVTRKLGLRDAAEEPWIKSAYPFYDAYRRIDARNQPVTGEELDVNIDETVNVTTAPAPPPVAAADKDPYGMKAYMAALAKHKKGQSDALDRQTEGAQSRKIQALAKSLLDYSGADTTLNEFQKLSKGFGGLSEDLADIETATEAAEVAKSSLDLEEEKQIYDLKLKLKAIEISAAKAGIQPKEVTEYINLVEQNEKLAIATSNSPSVPEAHRTLIKQLLLAKKATPKRTPGDTPKAPKSKESLASSYQGQ